MTESPGQESSQAERRDETVSLSLSERSLTGTQAVLVLVQVWVLAEVHSFISSGLLAGHTILG